MQQPPGWCPPPSTPDALHCFANLVGSEYGEFGVRDRDDPFTPLLQPHRGRRNLDLKTSIACANFQRLTRLEAEGLTQGFRNNDPPGSINGRFHGWDNAMKMA